MRTTPLDPFENDHPDGYLADSQFDYPGRPDGWQYHALDAENRFARFEPLPGSRDTATPLAFLGCDDPDARIGRDFVHPGYRRRPCLQWHAREAGTYRIEGEVGLVRSDARGNFRVRVIVDDIEVLTQTLSFPQVLTCEIDAAVRQGGFVRVLFHSVEHITGNDALFYLRIRPADLPCGPGESRIASRCEAPPAWARLREVLGAPEGTEPQDLASVALGLYRPPARFDPGFTALVQKAGRRHFAPHLARYRQPRFFGITARRADTEQG
jgi:hypothetical protein